MKKKRLQYISLLLFLSYLLNLFVPCLPVQAEVTSLSDSLAEKDPAPTFFTEEAAASDLLTEKGSISTSLTDGSLTESISFSDLAGHWAEKGIKAWTARRLAGGYPDGTFRPDSPITRAEFLTLLNRAFGYTIAGQVIYRDVAETDWFVGEIAKAAAVGYLGGYPDGTVKPQNPLTRQEAAVLFAKILPIDIDSNKNNKDDDKFTDQAQIPAWSQAAIAAAVSGGYMSGYPNGTFQPTRPITRAEAISVLDRAVGTLYNHAGTYGSSQGTTLLEGNVTINTAGITLQNTTITGNLYLTEGIGEGDVTLNNVTVQGTTKISGGGSNSIHLLNTTVGAVLVNVPSRNLVRLLAQGSTAVGTLEARTPAILEEEGLTGSGFTKVIINTQKAILSQGSTIPQEGTGTQENTGTENNTPAQETEPGITIELLGNFSEVEVQSAATQLDLQKGSIANLTLASTAQAAQINLAAWTGINTLTADTPATVQGQGAIERIEANVDGVVVEASIIGAEIKKKKSKDATLSDLMINGTTVPDFTADTLSYKVVLPYGTKEAPVVTATAHYAKAKVEITQAEGFAPSNNTATILVTAESGSTQTYTVNFTVALNFAKVITDFQFAALDPVVVGTISEEAKTIALTVPYGTDATSLIPTITHTGASISPASGAEQDFSDSVIYTVTAADGSTAEYTVTVTVLPSTDTALAVFTIGTEVVYDVLNPELPGNLTGEDGAILAVSDFGNLKGVMVEPVSANVQSVIVTVNGTEIAKDDLSKREIKANDVIVVKVVAEGGNTAQYTVTVVPILVDEITVTAEDGAAAIVGIGQTLQLSAAITPENATDKTVTWSVVDGTGTGHATIDNNGLLTGETEGTVTVIATANDGSGKQGSLEVTVVIPVTGVSLNKAVMFLQEGTTAEEPLIVTVEPDEATNKDVIWESDNPGVATVDNNGKVTAEAVGTAKIIATTDDRGKEAICWVKVVAPDSVTPIIDDSCVLYLDGSIGNAPATETWYDLSGKGNHGTLNNFAYAEGSGWTGQGLEFDGENDYVKKDVPDSFLADGKHTVEIWCNPADLGEYRGFIEIADKNTSNNIRLGRIMTYNDGKTIRYHSTFIGGSPVQYVDAEIGLNAVVHIVGTFDGLKTILYINGIKVGEKLGTDVPIFTAGQKAIYIGRDIYLDYDRYFKGTIYGARIYNRALSPAEIAQNYLATKDPMPLEPVDGAVLDLRGVENQYDLVNSKWLDASSYDNHATLHNIEITAKESLRFNGEDSYGECDVPDSFLADSKHTIEMWCNPADLGAYRGIIEIFDKASVDGYRIGRIMSFSDNSIRYHAVCSSASSPYIETTISTNEVVHLVGTYDGTTAKFYVNGQGVKSEAQSETASIPKGQKAIYIGRDTYPDRYFKGEIYGVRIYAKALSDAEVLQNYFADKNKYNP